MTTVREEATQAGLAEWGSPSYVAEVMRYEPIFESIEAVCDVYEKHIEELEKRLRVCLSS